MLTFVIGNRAIHPTRTAFHGNGKRYRGDG